MTGIVGVGAIARLGGVGSKIKSGVAWCFATSARLLVTVLVLAFAVQTVRIEGLFWFHEGYRAEVVRLTKTIDDMDDAGNVAVIQQTAMNNRRVATETKNAEIDDVKFEASKDVAAAAATVYIDRNSVRGTNQVCPAQADRAAESSPPLIPEEMPVRSVLVSEGDVQACTFATAYAIAAHNAAVSDVESGTAVFLPDAPAAAPE